MREVVAALPAPPEAPEATIRWSARRAASGLLGGVELVRDKATKEQFDPALKVNAQVVAKCLAHGLIVRPIPGDAIGICPPMIITAPEIDLLFDRLEAGLNDRWACCRWRPEG